MRPTLQRANVEASAREHSLHASHMSRFAGMGRTGECQFLVSKPIAVGRSGFHEHQRLNGLYGGARINRRLRVADVQNCAPARVHHTSCTAMPTFNQRAARHFDQDWIFHRVAFTANCQPFASALGDEALHLCKFSARDKRPNR